jgi:SAM-dependent methyltransferase
MKWLRAAIQTAGKFKGVGGSPAQKASRTAESPPAARKDVSAEHQLAQIEASLLDSNENGFEKSRGRWRLSRPNEGLTWGEYLPGDEFIAKAIEHGVFGRGKRILEIGPGYGRLIDAVQRLSAPLDRYVGMDISQTNIDFLQAKYTDNKFSFICSDAETSDFGGAIDGMYSSATLHHFYPTNQKLLINVSKHLSPRARVMYDVPEGVKSHFESDGETYIHWYSKKEISDILAEAGLKLVVFDNVKHGGGKKLHPRMLVIAEKL